jgi:glycosyltransferase involved in cell wall biosynthesis
VSGPNYSLMRLLQGLDRGRYEPIVYFAGDGEAVRAYSEAGEKCQVISMPPLQHTIARFPVYMADLARVSWRVRRTLVDDAIDLVHINTCVTPYPGIAARAMRLPVVWHVRECLRPNPINDLYLRGIVKLADRVVAVSGAVRAHVEQRVRGSGRKAVVINNGIDLDQFARAMCARQTKEELGLPDGQALIVVPAFLLPHKGHEVLIEATSYLVHQLHMTQCLVLCAGEEPPEERGRFTARLHELCRIHRVKEYVKFLGLRNDLPAVLAHADVVCLPSTCDDAFPNGVLEGMAAGKPVVASRVGGIPELIENGRTGLLVPCGHPRALAESLARLLKDRASAARMGSEARDRVVERFTARLSATRIQNLYEQVLEEHTRSPAGS